MVQQMHPGVSAPGGPQVSQAGPMMGGMPPGAGTTGPGGPAPNAHALSHLNPANAHMFQQQGFPQNFQNVANNPQVLQQQQQQQQLFRQRMMIQQQAQAHAQQQQQHGLPVSLPNGTQGLNAAQMAAMQANPRMNQVNMMHLQQQIPHGQQGLSQQQIFAIQQAQHAQQQVQANNGQPGQHTPQRSSVQPPSMHEGQAGTPQSQHGALPQSGTPQPNQPSQPPSTQPPQSQGPQQSQATPQPQPQPQPQQLPQTQQSGQQPAQPGQPQQPQQGAQGQQGQVSGPPSQQALAAQEAQLKAQQHQNQAALMMQQQQQQQRLNRQGQAILCLHSYAEHLGNFVSRGEANDHMYWHTFVDRFYSPVGVLRQGVWSPQDGSKQFEISTPALARFYLTQFTSGIKRIQMVVEGARERDTPNGGHIVEAGKAYFIYWFTNDTQLFTNGHLRAQFDINNKIDMLDFTVTSHNEYVPRALLQSLEASEQKQSPKATKNSGKRGQKQAPSITLPESMVTPNGVPGLVLDFLEMAETISHMQMLFNFSQQNPNLSPPEALRNLVNTLHTHGPTAQFATPMNPGMQGMQGMQPVPNPRGPNMNGPSQFASPAMAHLGLPGSQGSPHMTGSAHASPAQSQIAGAPGMPVQPSPVGVNNSPNVGGNKRRRASTVKMESEDGSGEVNGTGGQGSAKVKASPRVPKRQKGAAS